MTSLILDKYKDKFGQVILNDEGLFELIYGGHALDHVKAEKTQSTEQYNYYIEEYEKDWLFELLLFLDSNNIKESQKRISSEIDRIKRK